MKPFLENLPALPPWIKQHPDGRAALYLDNLLLATYNECEQKFYYRHIRNLAGKGTGGGKGAAMWGGIWWASTMEYFYKGMMDYQNKKKGSCEPSESTIVQAAGKAWTDNNMEPNIRRPTGDSFQELFTAAYDKFKGVEGAVSMAIQYYRAYAEHDVRNWKIIAMEMGFGYGNEILVYEDKDIIVFWCGRPDLVVYEDDTNNLICVDHKAPDYIKSNFIQKWKPHPQTTGYVYALQILSESLGYNLVVDRCMINGAARFVAEKPRKKPSPRFLRPRPHYNPAEIQEWRSRTGQKARRLYESFLNNEWAWRESACHVYAGCQYRGIDNQPPQTREVVISSSYVEIKPWAPYVKLEEGEEDAA